MLKVCSRSQYEIAIRQIVNTKRLGELRALAEPIRVADVHHVPIAGQWELALRERELAFPAGSASR